MSLKLISHPSNFITFQSQLNFPEEIKQINHYTCILQKYMEKKETMFCFVAKIVRQKIFLFQTSVYFSVGFLSFYDFLGKIDSDNAVSPHSEYHDNYFFGSVLLHI